MENRRCESCWKQESEHVWLKRQMVLACPSLNTVFVPAPRAFLGLRFDVS